ncbi:type II toxin-antitoxin system CcdA family antitoxin [Glaciecola sp. XM2]|jgi:post-segregation antitoxin (ccd killing protein)|uniref:type II toxin-antitoxin system CcdA family antitoxin n=1 Tax=Glaciecola sp. XM2 TaxID=1914931 RepID=UPI001BDE10F0|nr:type II toxin-antitoxin system CcdA family antitoxin [Glaciecola sp. XM2]MBT1451458.1 type II toxin-antitoxin system CcdA family antitoxin [Glaciecola sp. XM2]
MGTAKEKVRVNVYLDKTLTNDAKRLGINLSNSLELALKSELAKKWKEKNREKIATYNQRVAAKGLPFDDEDMCI